MKALNSSERWVSAFVKKVQNLVRPSVSDLHRVVVEGTYPDDWAQCHFCIWKSNIPPDTTIVNILNYDLKLVGRWGDKGITLVGEDETEPKRVLFDEKFSPQIIPRPRTIITDDGSVFYDTSLSEQGFLEIFLRGLYVRYCEKNPAVQPKNKLPY